MVTLQKKAALIKKREIALKKNLKKRKQFKEIFKKNNGSTFR
tara:strand:- start:380 stop:505 length:126 start_codon:yes stop_codon:yes gene_type:complete